MHEMTRFGVNYVPSNGWWYCWQDWDGESIGRDFDAIAGLGADHIRIHCLWPLFQPNPTMVSAEMLDRLADLLRRADAAGLDVIVTVFNGWLSGFDFRPSWLADDANIFTDPDVVAAEFDLLASMADRIGNHPRFLGFDVANEPSVLATSVKNVSTVEEGDRWVASILEQCERVAPGKMHSIGMDHLPWLTDDTPFSRNVLAQTGSLTPIHAWIFFTGALARYGQSSTGVLHLAEYMLELARAYQSDGRRPLWLQEYGVSTEWIDPSSIDDFVEQSTRISARVENLWGITWWCSHDISRSLSGFIELEYDLGLFTVDNKIKPMGKRFRSTVAAIRNGQGEQVQAQRTTAIVLPRLVTPDLDFADHFFHLIDKNVCPAIVLEERASDIAYLASRGITTVISVGELVSHV